MHPLSKKLKEISKNRDKKDEHYQAMARIEFEGSLYYQDDIGIYMPSKCLAGSFKSAAKKFKQGKNTKALTVDCAIGTPLIGYEGKTSEQLWNTLNKNGEQTHVFAETVVVNRARIVRTRPIFQKWEIKFEVYLNTEILSFDWLKRIIETAGFECGLCELRPEKASGTYGRFTLHEIKES
jgi:hypothetical protein